MGEMNAMPVLPPNGGALIASPSDAVRQRVISQLNGRWRPVQQAAGGAEALAKLEKGGWQVLFLDRQLPDLDAEELIAIIERRFPGIQVVMVNSDQQKEAETPTISTVEDPASPLAAGTPADAHVAHLGFEPLPGMIGNSEAMQRVYRMVRLVAPRQTTVLIAGPTGSGKELVAQALHALSPRSARPFVVVNCAAIPEALLESELFGYMRGAFTGAVQSQLGRIPAASGGTLFLDEISELPLGMQAKLLRFLESKEIQRLGSTEAARVDVRVVAASNVDLAGRVERREFREDLFYRLTSFPITLPALRERRGDVVPLAEYFLARVAETMNMTPPWLSTDAIRILEEHEWKGNVRELQHVMERASILLEQHEMVRPEHLFFSGFDKGRRLAIA